MNSACSWQTRVTCTIMNMSIPMIMNTSMITSIRHTNLQVHHQEKKPLHNSFAEIKQLILSSKLNDSIKDKSLAIFVKGGRSRSKNT